MNERSPIALCALICIALAAVVHAADPAQTNAAPPPVSITNTSGQVFERCKIEQVTPLGLKIFHSKGIATVPFSELPETIQRQYNYDPKKAEAYVTEARKQQAQTAETAKIMRQLTDNVTWIKGTVTQKTANGLLLITEDANIVMLVGYPKEANLVDGDKVETTCYLVDHFQYVTVLGATKTIRRYAMTPQIGYRLLNPN